MFKARLWFSAAASLAVLLTVLCMRSAQAGTITFITPPGSTNSAGLPVNAEAVLLTSRDTLTVTLADLQTNQKSVGQNVSDLGFEISTGQTDGTLTTSAGLERTVAGNGSFTDGSVVSTGWELDSAGAPFRLHVL